MRLEGHDESKDIKHKGKRAIITIGPSSDDRVAEQRHCRLWIECKAKQTSFRLYAVSEDESAWWCGICGGLWHDLGTWEFQEGLDGCKQKLQALNNKWKPKGALKRLGKKRGEHAA